jgi:GNAT superfamily N-acetyltransferase
MSAALAAPPNLTVVPVHPRTMSDEELARGLEFGNRLRAERLPDDPPMTLEESRLRARNIPEFVDLQAWRVTADGETGPVVASAHFVVVHSGNNEHLGDFGVEVLPEFRGRGIGRTLLGHVVAAARERGRSLLTATSSGRVPAGAAFLERIGGQRGLESHVNQLEMAELDPVLLASWHAKAAESGVADAFEVGWWDGPYPEAEVETILALYNTLFVDVPFESLNMQPPRFTVEMTRQSEREMAARGSERWVVWARDRATGAYAGLTELTWSPHRPFLASQGLTGVLPAYRGRGLGRLLKAAMLERVRNERPEVRLVRTENADSNAAMLGINRALGFRPYASETVWQVPVERAEAYLRGTAAP